MQLFHNQPLPPCGSSTRRGRGVYITRNTTGLNYFDFCAFESFRSLWYGVAEERLSPDSHNVLVPQDLPPGPASAHVHITLATRLALLLNVRFGPSRADYSLG